MYSSPLTSTNYKTTPQRKHMPAPLSIGQFDPLRWVNEYTRPAIEVSTEAFAPILHFVLMWNLFERDACGKEANPASIERAVNRAFSDGNLSGQDFREHLLYFRHLSSRHGPGLEPYFTALKLTNERAKYVVGGVLNGTLNDPNNVVYALLLIAHRIRNNLFHGEKEVAILHAQAELFQAVNSLLASYLSLTTQDAHI
jgi:hypothetical protein